MADRTERELRAHMGALCRRIGPRMIGTPGDAASAEYVESHFQRLGLEVISNSMPCTGWDLLGTTLRVGGRSFSAIGNMCSPAGRVKAPLVLCEPDLPQRALAALKGAAVAVYGDFEPFPLRLNSFARRAERAGVACLIVIDADPTSPATKLIRELSLRSMPVMSVSLETGYRLARLEGRQAECSVRSRRYRSSTRDVIGILTGGRREISVEAHRDTAPGTPGADDNASGTVVLLELARLLVGERLRHTVRFVSATAEEFGNIGTPRYARAFAAEIRRTDLAINADSVGGALCPLRVHIRRSDAIVPLARRLLRPTSSMKLNLTEVQLHGQISEYLGPTASAISVVDGWANARIHTAMDRPSNLSTRKMAEVARFLRDLILAFDARTVSSPRQGSGRRSRLR